MKIFFLIAGFFGAVLFYERSPKKMLENRIKRLVLPFTVFVLLLWPIIVFLIIDLDAALATGTVVYTLNTYMDLIPQRTFHLWFLYYLCMITFVSVGLALVLKRLPAVTNSIHQVFDTIIQRPILRVFVFASITAGTCFLIGQDIIEPEFGFVPDWKTFIYYFTFYIVGWLLYKSKKHLDSFTTYDRGIIGLGLVLFLGYFLSFTVMPQAGKNILNPLVTWSLVFGITSVFIRYGSKHSAVMRYVSDASYWVYLVHLPFTIYFPNLLFGVALPSTVKALMVMMLTSMLCFISYHYLVRSTFIGKFLNGRKYSRKIADIKDPATRSELKPALD